MQRGPERPEMNSPSLLLSQQAELQPEVEAAGWLRRAPESCWEGVSCAWPAGAQSQAPHLPGRGQSQHVLPCPAVEKRRKFLCEDGDPLKKGTNTFAARAEKLVRERGRGGVLLLMPRTGPYRSCSSRVGGGTGSGRRPAELGCGSSLTNRSVKTPPQAQLGLVVGLTTRHTGSGRPLLSQVLTLAAQGSAALYRTAPVSPLACSGTSSPIFISGASHHLRPVRAMASDALISASAFRDGWMLSTLPPLPQSEVLPFASERCGLYGMVLSSPERTIGVSCPLPEGSQVGRRDCTSCLVQSALAGNHACC